MGHRALHRRDLLNQLEVVKIVFDMTKIMAVVETGIDLEKIDRLALCVEKNLILSRLKY